MHNLKLKQITIALCVALMPISSFAAGLGKLNVTSALGEPLKADIELISVTPTELENITAVVASEETYVSQGLEKPASHNNIKVEIGKNASGAPILKLKSNQVINEPFLDMLIQVDWSTGRLLREYTVLLDPPGYVGEQSGTPSTVDSPMVATSASKTDSANADVTQSRMTEDKSATKKSKAKKNAEKNTEVTEEVLTEITAPEAAGAEYTTERGDSLMKIARDMKLEGVSLEQMLVGLYDANPNAFVGKNMNRLKVGQIIRQPSQEALNAISKNEAQREIKVQAANWNEYRQRLAGMVANEPVTEADTDISTQSSSGKIKGTAEDQSALANNGPKDVVKLSAADSASKSNDAKATQAKITASQEESTARENSVKEAQSRAADLEKQISDMQKLLALKNNAMADLQKQSAVSPTTPANTATTVKQAENAKIADVKPAANEMPATEPVKQVDAANVAESPKPVVKPVVKPAPVLPPPVKEDGFVASLFSGLDVATLLPLGGLLVALGGGWLFLRNKRKRNLADFEQGIMTSGGLKANTVFGNTSGATVDTGDTSFLTDFSQSGSAGMIDTNDVDPIAEAEVYMAYGRDAQAEEILKDAIVKEPKRYELHLKLLEMYAASQNNSAFEAISGELYTTLGADSPEWTKVAEIGIQVEPNNPLYQVKAGTSANSEIEKSTAEKLDIADFSNIPLADESDFDHSSDEPSVQLIKVRADDAVEAKTSLQNDLDDFDLEFDSDQLTNEIEAESTSKIVDASEIQFEMPEVAESAADPVELNGDDLNFDVTDLGFDFNQPTIEQASEEPVATIMEDVQVPIFDLTSFGENSLNEDMTSNEIELTDANAPDTINLDVITAVFPATFAPNEAEEPMTLLSETPVSFEEGNKDLNVPTISNDVSDFMNADFNEANVIDISNISLDLNDYSSAVNGDEPADVETKLELVAAYIDMDDEEGAKELISEVIAEGGPSQRKRAEAILAKLS